MSFAQIRARIFATPPLFIAAEIVALGAMGGTLPLLGVPSVYAIYCDYAWECDDANGCTDDDCVSNECQNNNNTAACDDGQYCTDGDVCSGGSCTSGGSRDCSDANSCTDDSCNETNDTCDYTNNNNACDDGNVCTDNDTCSGGSCGGTPNNNSCDDGDACTENEVCSAGSCGGGSAVNCDDSNACTDDSCNPASGCVNTSNVGSCDQYEANSCDCTTETWCHDSTDNDQDSYTDCADSDCGDTVCSSSEENICDCTTETWCHDSTDNDQDATTDCSDADCFNSVCSESEANSCDCTSETWCHDSTDNDQDATTDCADGDCGDTVCSQSEENSCDCATETWCSDGVDNDQDSLMDHSDTDCIICGDSAIDSGEECDDGNTTNGDGCNNTCQQEQGWACDGLPSACTHPVLLVNTEAFQVIDDADTASDVSLQFGDGLDKNLTYSRTLQQFEFDAPLAVTGNISATGSIFASGSLVVEGTAAIHGVLSGNTIANATLQNVTISGTANSLLNIGTGSLALHTRQIAIGMNDATVSMDGTSNAANVFSASDTGANPHQYYIIKTGSGQLQDLTLHMKVRVPRDFADFGAGNDVSFWYKNTGTGVTDSKIDILVEDKDGDDAFPAAEGLGLFNAAWTQYVNEFDGGSFNPVADEFLYITAKGSARYNSGNLSPYVGEIVLTYRAR